LPPYLQGIKVDDHPLSWLGFQEDCIMASCRRGESNICLPYPALEEEIAIARPRGVHGGEMTRANSQALSQAAKSGYQCFSFR
jgi:hypothetical protein